MKKSQERKESRGIMEGKKNHDDVEYHSKIMYGSETGRVAIEDFDAKIGYRATNRIDKLEYWMYREMIQQSTTPSTQTIKRMSDDARSFLLDQASMNVLDLGGRMDEMVSQRVVYDFGI